MDNNVRVAIAILLLDAMAGLLAIQAQAVENKVRIHSPFLPARFLILLHIFSPANNLGTIIYMWRLLPGLLILVPLFQAKQASIIFFFIQCKEAAAAAANKAYQLALTAALLLVVTYIMANFFGGCAPSIFLPRVQSFRASIARKLAVSSW